MLAGRLQLGQLTEQMSELVEQTKMAQPDSPGYWQRPSAPAPGPSPPAAGGGWRRETLLLLPQQEEAATAAEAAAAKAVEDARAEAAEAVRTVKVRSAQAVKAARAEAAEERERAEAERKVWRTRAAEEALRRSNSTAKTAAALTKAEKQAAEAEMRAANAERQVAHEKARADKAEQAREAAVKEAAAKEAAHAVSPSESSLASSSAARRLQRANERADGRSVASASEAPADKDSDAAIARLHAIAQFELQQVRDLELSFDPFPDQATRARLGTSAPPPHYPGAEHAQGSRALRRDPSGNQILARPDLLARQVVQQSRVPPQPSAAGGASSQLCELTPRTSDVMRMSEREAAAIEQLGALFTMPQNELRAVLERRRWDVDAAASEIIDFGSYF